MLTVQLKYLRYAAGAFVMALLTAVVLPILIGMQPILSVNIPYLTKAMLAIPAVLIIWLDYGMIRQALAQQREEGVTTLWLPIIGQTLWFVVLTWLLVTPALGNFVKTMTLPMMLLGWAGLMISLGLLQRRERAIALDEAGIKSAMRLESVALVAAVYATLFYGITLNWQSGLTVAVSVLIIIDPRWPAMWSAYRRFRLLRQLADQGLKFQNPRALDDLPKITDIVAEKSGVLTSNDLKIRSITSVDDRYSDYDVLGITAGLLAGTDTPMAQALLQYAREYNVYPSEASEQEKIPYVGASGVINNERFQIVSASYASEHYEINEATLDQLIALGNSVSYIIDGVQIIGVLTYAATFNADLLKFDRFLASRHINLHIVTADTNGSLFEMQKTLRTLVQPQANLTPEAKLAAQASLLRNDHTLLVTNQAVPVEIEDAMVVGVNGALEFADIKAPGIAQLHELWNTADLLQQNDHRVLTITTILSALLIILAAGVGVFFSSWLFIAPIFAVGIRLVLSLTLSAVVSED
uniref:ATPase P n=1 Tax=Weissella soli TaxID=155866 RepID=UPI0035A05597